MNLSVVSHHYPFVVTVITDASITCLVFLQKRNIYRRFCLLTLNKVLK